MVQKSWDCCVFDVSKKKVYSSKNSCCSATKLPNMFVNRRWFLHGFFFIKISIFANSPETKSQIPDLILSKHRSKTLMFWLKAKIPAPLVSQITSFPPFLSLSPPPLLYITELLQLTSQLHSTILGEQSLVTSILPPLIQPLPSWPYRWLGFTDREASNWTGFIGVCEVTALMVMELCEKDRRWRPS